MYTVIVMFRDKHDGGHIYLPGDEYPRKGYSPDGVRIAELAGTNNARGRPLIVNTNTECAECANKALKAKKPTRKRVKKDD